MLASPVQAVIYLRHHWIYRLQVADGALDGPIVVVIVPTLHLDELTSTLFATRRAKVSVQHE